jgi:uncharacterized protein YbjT (DUF2867 family)
MSSQGTAATLGAREIKGAALVFGATGFTGREVVRLAEESGIATIAHVRPDSPRLVDWRHRFAKMGAEVDATAWEEKALTETLKRVRPAIVFSLLGTTRARIKQAAAEGRDPQTQDYDSVDYGLTVMLLKAAAAAGIKPRFVYLSAAGANKPGMSAYSRTRYKTEQAVISSGVPYTIARPSFIIGPDRDDRRMGEIFGARFLDGLLVLAGALGAKKLRDRYHSTSNTILASALVRLSLDPAAENTKVESEDLRQ